MKAEGVELAALLFAKGFKGAHSAKRRVSTTSIVLPLEDPEIKRKKKDREAWAEQLYRDAYAKTLKKSRGSNLIPKKVSVTRGGKTFLMNIYVGESV